MSFARIRESDGLWLGGPLEEEPAAVEGETIVVVPLGYGDTMEWSPSRRGFVDIAASAASLMTVGRFWLLLTQAERMSLYQAADSSLVVRDFITVIQGFTAGVSLADPALVGAIMQFQQAGYLSSARVAQILAGSPPA